VDLTMTASESSIETHYGACNLCEAICGLEFKVKEGKILSIRGDDADPFSHGHICPKAVALKDIHEDPDRLRKPVKRTADGWQEISWDEAFNLVVDRLVDIRNQHGANSIGVYQGNPSVHNYGSLTHAQHFLGPLKTRNRYSATSVDQLPHQLIAYWMFGHQLLVPISDIDRTDYFLVMGANPMASNGSLMTVPDFRGRLKALQARGGRMIVIDPRRTETAEVADEHHFIRPGTDAAFLFALLNTLAEENLVNPGPLSGFTDGLDAALMAIRAFTPERVAPVTGIEAGTIRRIAREFAAAKGAAAYGRIGLSIQPFGTLCQWAIQLLNIATGNLDRVGGVLFTTPAVDLIGGPNSKPGHFAAWKSRVSGRPEFGGELPVSALAEEILTPADGSDKTNIRAMITIAGNPVLSTPNGAQLDRALAQLDFMVAVDFYINETTRHAHVILPPTCGVEHDHYDLIFNIFAVRNVARYSEALVPKPEGTMHDWEIYTELGKRLAARLGTKTGMNLRPDQIVDIGLRVGPYGKDAGHSPTTAFIKMKAEGVLAKLGINATPALSIEQLRQAPHGVDLGPLQPSLPARLQTQDKRIRCAIPEVLNDIPRLEHDLFSSKDSGGLRLIGRRHVRSNNSWMHNYERLVKGKARHQLLMHPSDLASRQLQDGQTVRVKSRVGQVDVEVQACDSMMPGVVSLPHGWGHSRKGVRLQVAQNHAGVSVNDLTDDHFNDVLSGNSALNGVPVSVEAA
jgi:anaerobic selenocysteine-containing dehydrogenase